MVMSGTLGSPIYVTKKEEEYSAGAGLLIIRQLQASCLNLSKIFALSPLLENKIQIR
jgi:hypothetical protein